MSKDSMSAQHTPGQAAILRIAVERGRAGNTFATWEESRTPGYGEAWARGAAIAACPDCNGSGEIFTHAEDCQDALCALNGDQHSCTGRLEPCECAAIAKATGSADPMDQAIVDNGGRFTL